MNIIYVHSRKILNLFARALETARKASLWRVQINAHVYCAYPQCQKVQNNDQII